MVKQGVSEKSDDAQGGAEPAGVPFFLKAIVIGMGVLLVVGLGVVLSTIIYRSVKSEKGVTSAAPSGVLVKTVPVMLGIAPGSIRNIALDGNRVAVQTDTEIILVDIRRRTVIGRIKLNALPTSN